MAARTVKVPKATEVDRALVAEFITALGHDPATALRVRISAAAVQVDLRPKPDLKVTVTHPVVWED